MIRIFLILTIVRVPLIMDYTVDYGRWSHLYSIPGKGTGKLISFEVFKLLQKYA